jgi:hypothetical protein
MLFPARRPALLAGFLLLVVLAAVPPSARADGIFVADCRLSHRAMNDPIVFHGMRGASHRHDFFGNASTNASSTVRSLRASRGNCVPAQDRSAYWVPTLYRRGRPVRPVKFQAYYRDFLRFGRVLPFPSGLRVVAGSATARTGQFGVVQWLCDDQHVGGSPTTIPRCGDQPVTLRIAFPGCWDGRRLDSPDHRAHMAYHATGGRVGILGRCPSSHPVHVPELTVNVTYPMHDGAGVALASGSVVGAHADFFNAWQPAALRAQVDRALNGGMACSPLLGCARLTGPNAEPVIARPRRRLVDRFHPPSGRRRAAHRRHAH